MHILLLGATGNIGRLVTADALSRGHTITALVRTPSALPPTPGLTILPGTPLSAPDLAAAFTASPTPIHAVLLTLRLRTTSASPLAALRPDTNPHLGHDTVSHLLPLMRRHGAARLVVLSAQGAGSSAGSLTALHRAVFCLGGGMRAQQADHGDVDAAVRAAAREWGGGLEFVLVRSVMMVEGGAREVRDLGDEGVGAGWMPKVTTGSVARFMVEAVEGREFVGRAPVICN